MNKNIAKNGKIKFKINIEKELTEYTLIINPKNNEDRFFICK